MPSPNDTHGDDAATPALEHDLQSAHHARYIESDVVYHVMFKTDHSFMLLTPDEKGMLEELIAGVIGRALVLYKEVDLFAAVYMSNHGHLLLRGPVATESVSNTGI